MCEELLSIIDAWQGKRIVVIGDLCLDQWHECMPRDNPECDAPCFTLGAMLDRKYGMSQLVASLVESLGGRAEGVSRSEFATKTRLMFSGRQVARIDCDPPEVLPADVHDLVERAAGKVRYHADAVIVSDYAKGTCVEQVCQAVIAQARECGTPVLVDPARGADWRKYDGATWIKANRIESNDAAEIPCDLCDAVIITEGRFGMQAHHLRPYKSVQLFDATMRHAVDPCGCGDACAAVLGLCLAVRAPIDLACRLANHAGGLAVEQHGTPRITAAMLREDVRRMAAVCSDASSRPTSTRK